MPSPLDNAPDKALAGLFLLKDESDNTVVAHWGEALKATAIDATIRMERQTSLDEPAVKTRRVGRVDDAELDYVVGALIGKGGGGRVFEARQVSANRTVALKRLLPEYADIPVKRARFLREALLAAEFDHPNLLAVYDVGNDQDGQPFFTMPRVEGIPWSKSIRERALSDNLAILAKLADAVAHLHARGVVHRDLKPANVLLGPHGEILLIDWGLAAKLPEPGKGRGLPPDAEAGGTPLYMSPEMARDDRTLIGYASDVYLLGAILYEILTGTPPHIAKTTEESLTHAANSVPEKTKDLRGPLGRLTLHCLQHDSALRPTIAAFIQTIHKSIHGTRHKLFVGGLVFVALGLIIGSWLSFRDTRETPIQTQEPTTQLPTPITGEGDSPLEDDEHADSIGKLPLEVERLLADKKSAFGPNRERATSSKEDLRNIRTRLDELGPAYLSQVRLHNGYDGIAISLRGTRVSSFEFLRGCSNIIEVDAGNAGITDLEPLRGNPIVSLLLDNNNVTDISALQGMPLKVADLSGNPISSIAALRGAPLKNLSLGGTLVDDLTPLTGAPLEALDLGGRTYRQGASHRPIPASNLEPLRGMPLKYLRREGMFDGKDLTPPVIPLESIDFLYGNTTLTALCLARNAITDISPLRNIPLRYLDLADNLVSDLTPLTKSPLDLLNCRYNRIRDLSPLEGSRIGVLLSYGNPIEDYSVYQQLPFLRRAWRHQTGLPLDMPEELRNSLKGNLRPIRLSDSVYRLMGTSNDLFYFGYDKDVDFMHRKKRAPLIME